MSEPEVEIVRDALDAFIAGDIEDSLRLAHPEIVTFRAPPLPDAREYRGREGVVQTFTDWTEQFGAFEMQRGEIVEAGDRVIAEVIQRAEGQSSGAAVEGRFWMSHAVVDGLIVRLDIYNSKEQAVEAAESGSP